MTDGERAGGPGEGRPADGDGDGDGGDDRGEGVAGAASPGDLGRDDGPEDADREGLVREDGDSGVRLDQGPAGRPDGPGGPDPAVVRSVAVAAEDLLAAVEANVRDRLGGRAVLRVTPPFAPRMRARLHVLGAGRPGRDGEVPGRAGAAGPDAGEATDGTTPSPVHLDPESFVESVPPFPHPDDTEDELRAADVEYTPERHRRRHEAAVAEWRETVRARVRDRVPFPVGDGPTGTTRGTGPEGDREDTKTVAVSVLGGPGD